MWELTGKSAQVKHAQCPRTKEEHKTAVGNEATEFSLLFFLLMFGIFLVIAAGNIISWANKKDLCNYVAGRGVQRESYLVLEAVRISVPPCPESRLHPELNPASFCLCFIYYLQHRFAQMLRKSPWLGEFVSKWATEASKQAPGRRLKLPQGGTDASCIPSSLLLLGAPSPNIAKLQLNAFYPQKKTHHHHQNTLLCL